MVMSDKLRGSTTISTEVRTYLTDSLSKKSLARATVAARSAKLVQQDVEVTQIQPHTITRHSNKYLQISCAFPVMATFIPGTPEIEYPVIPGSTYTTGVLYVDDMLEAGQPLLVSLYDPDVASRTVQVTVFNATTGETETLVLSLLDNGMYQGKLLTCIARCKGVDFDAVLNMQPNDTIRIIYNDGRGALGEPVQVIHNASVFSSVVAPEIFVRRSASPVSDVTVGIVGVIGIPVVTVTNRTTNVSHNLPVTFNGLEYLTVFKPVNLWPDIAIGDVLLVEYTYLDIFGSAAQVTASCLINTGETVGTLTVPATIQRGYDFVVLLDDPDVDVPYVDLVISGTQTGVFTRWRALRQAIGSGKYVYTTALPPLFDRDTSITVTYADTVNGAPKLVQRIIPIETTSIAPLPPVIVPDAPVLVEQLAMQMEINGLFVLNGRFSGTIMLRAVENEIVRCSITQAS
jgi:hypothetical protein